MDTRCPPVDAESLDEWLADPLSGDQAAALLGQARTQLQASLRAGQPCFSARIREMVARYWLGRDIEGDYLTLAHEARSDAERALADLAYGQLLMSRKRTGALAHLQRGFARAAQVLAPRTYFTLLRRHTLLAQLPLSPGGAAPLSLADLLVEAGVIRRLRQALDTRRRPRHDACDTIG